MDYINQVIEANAYRRPDKPQQLVMDVEDVKALVQIVRENTLKEVRERKDG